MRQWNGVRWSVATVVLTTLVWGATAFGTAPQAAAVRLHAGTGSAGSGYFVLGSAIVNLVSNHVDGITLVPEVAPSSSETVVLLSQGERHLGLAPADTVYRGRHGIGEFNQKFENVRVMFAANYVGMSHVVMAGSGIESIADLRGKRLASVSPATEPLTRGILRAQGIKDDEYQHQYLSQPDQVTALREGAIDAAQLLTFPRSATLLDLSTSADVRILKVDVEIMQKFRGESPFYAAVPVAAGTYRGQDEMLVSTGLATLYLASADKVTDDTAYRIVKAVMENRQELIDVNPGHAAVSLDQLRSYIEQGLIVAPFHPGARRYFEEQGIAIPAGL